MKSLLSLIWLATLTLAHADFILRQTVTADGKSDDIVIKCKGDKIRIDEGNERSRIADNATGKAFVLDHNKRECISIEADSMISTVKEAKRIDRARGVTDKRMLTDLGQEKVIAGYTAHAYSFKEGDVEAVYWLAPKYPEYKRILNELMRNSTNVLGVAGESRGIDPKEFPGMPVAIDISFQGGKITSILRSIEEKPVPDDAFAVPAGFKHLDARSNKTDSK